MDDDWEGYCQACGPDTPRHGWRFKVRVCDAITQEYVRTDALILCAHHAEVPIYFNDFTDVAHMTGPLWREAWPQEREPWRVNV